ncbi:ribonuclease H-like domain-containing protein [Tanacetum coccineum]
MITRSQSGIVKPIDHLSLHTYSISPIPKNPSHALKDLNWRNVMYDEYNALVKNSTWLLVPRPAGVNMVRFMWLFKHKFHAEGNLSRYKARLVANGSSQQLGVDFDEKFSSVIKRPSFAWFLALPCLISGLYTNLMLRMLFLTIISSLNNEFDMADLGALNYFLGISADRTPTGLFLSQKKYALQLLERAHMVTCNPSRTPVDTKSKLGLEVQQICLYMHDLREPHLAALKRIFEMFRVYLSAEAEYRGVANVVAETALLRNLLRELHSSLSTATLVFCDNVSAVYMSVNPVQHQQTKHIEIDIHFVRYMVTAGQVRVLHVPSRFQYADIFTKGLPSALFEEFRSSLSFDVYISTHMHVNGGGLKRSFLNIETEDSPGLLLEVVKIRMMRLLVESAEGLVAQDKLNVSYMGTALNESLSQVLRNCLSLQQLDANSDSCPCICRTG